MSLVSTSDRPSPRGGMERERGGTKDDSFDLTLEGESRSNRIRSETCCTCACPLSIVQVKALGLEEEHALSFPVFLILSYCAL